MAVAPKLLKSREKTPPESIQRVYEFLKVHPVGVLTTVGRDNKPHGTVMYFATGEDLEITFTTKRGTKKHFNLQANNNVMIVAYEASTQTTVQISGIAEEITDATEAQAAYRHTLRLALQTSEAGVPPISKLFAGEYVAYRLKLTQIRMAVFTRPDPGGYDIYETLDFTASD